MDSQLAASYELCRKLHARHGRTYYLASQLLPREKRAAVSVLYGFARYVDDIVDVEVNSAPDPARLDRVTAILLAAIDDGGSEHPILAATVDVVRRFEIPVRLITEFLESMRMDLLPQRYQTWNDLRGYTWGSACVIGLQMTYIIGVVAPRDQAEPRAAALGDAFQLTNFCRDFLEDRQRGRVYLPQEDFQAQGIDDDAPDSPALRRVIAANVDRARSLYRDAEPGIAMLHPEGRDCVRTAFVLYQGILDEIEANDYDVFGQRLSVPNSRRLQVALPALVHAWTVRASSVRRDRAIPTSR